MDGLVVCEVKEGRIQMVWTVDSTTSQHRLQISYFSLVNVSEADPFYQLFGNGQQYSLFLFFILFVALKVNKSF
jgi:hypothetical protein